MAAKSVEWLAPYLARWAEKKPQHFPDSLQISIDSAERLKGRGNDPVVAKQVEDAVKKLQTFNQQERNTVGPTPYEQQKAQEDSWE